MGIVGALNGRPVGEAEYQSLVLDIQAYDYSVGRRSPLPLDYEDPGNLSDDLLLRVAERAEDCRRWSRFGARVDQVIAREMNPHDAVTIMPWTPEALALVGVPDLAWVTTQRHIRNELAPRDALHRHRHGLPPETLKRLPEELERPAVVIENRDGCIVCMLDLVDENRQPIVVPIDPGAQDRVSGRGLLNFVLSTYGRERASEYLARAVRLAAILSVDRDALLSLEGKSDLSVPASLLRTDGLIRRLPGPYERNPTLFEREPRPRRSLSPSPQPQPVEDRVR